MSSKYYDNPKNLCACDKFQFILDDYESLLLSHEETTKQLRALEDAIEDITEDGSRCYWFHEIDDQGHDEEYQSHKILRQAIENSRARKQNGT